MSGIGIASLTFVCAFGGAILGNYIRAAIPPAHLSKESQDVMKLGMGLVATMTARDHAHQGPDSMRSNRRPSDSTSSICSCCVNARWRSRSVTGSG